MTFNSKKFSIVIVGVKKMSFQAIFAQVRPPRAKMVEKCEKALITIIVIDMLVIEGPESLPRSYNLVHDT